MSRRRRHSALVTLIWVLLVAWFSYRAAVGFIAGRSHSVGRRLAAEGRYEEALPALERAAHGELFASASWLAGQTRLGVWQSRIAEGESLEMQRPLLDAAIQETLSALAESPASGWYWMALGDLFHQQERVERFERGESLALFGSTPWAGVGRSGRVAIGLMRRGLEREPNWYLFHDQIAYVLYDYRLKTQALEAVQASARALPVYEMHAYRTLRPPDQEVNLAFARGAREAIGGVPWLRDVLHRIALGRLAVRLERWEQAEQDLLAALAGPTESVNVAEASYYLALSVYQQGRYEEARGWLEGAESHPAILPMALFTRAEWAEAGEEWAEAQRLWIAVRRLEPMRLDVVFRLADVAMKLGDAEQAVHVLREGRRRHPQDAGVAAALVRAYLASEQPQKARGALQSLRELAPDHPAIPGLQSRLESLGRADIR